MSGDYFPRAKCTLVIRFEEFGKKVFDGKVPPKPAKNLKGIKDERAPLVVTNDPEAPPGVTRFLLKGSSSGAKSGGSPVEQKSSEDNLTHAIAGIIPKEAGWNQNGIRIADTLSVTIKFLDCPIDPRTVRSCAIVFYLGCITQEDHADGIAGTNRQGGDGFAGQSMDMLPDEYTDDRGQQRTNKRFEGFVDKWENSWDENGEPIVRLECRDNTSLLLGEEMPPKLACDPKVPLPDSVAGFLTHFPALEGMTIEYRPSGRTPPSLNEALAKTAFRPQSGPPASKGGGGSTRMKIWDYLTDVCGSLGHSIRVEGSMIVIQRVRTLVSGSGTQRDDDPFTGREDFPFRRWIYGRNVLSLKTQRNFSTSQPTNIEVRSYWPERKTVVVGRFPNKGDTQKTSTPGDGGADQKWLVFHVQGIRDPKTLQIIGQHIYESIGRNEMVMHVKTKNLGSFGGSNLDPDVLDMRAGDTFELMVNREEDEEFNTYTKIEKYLSVQERNADFMRSLGFDAGLSNAYAKAYTDAGFQTQYKSKVISMHWSIDSGVDIDIQGMNYVEIRADKFLEGETS